MPVIQNALPAQTAAGADSTTAIGVFEATDGSGTGVTRVELVPPPGFTTVTGIATNNAQFTFRLVRAGSVVQANVAQLALTAGNNLVAETPINVPISNAVNVQPDDTFDCVMHQNGTGLAIGAGVLAVIDIA